MACPIDNVPESISLVYEARLRKVPLEVAAVQFSFGKLRRPHNSSASNVRQAGEAIATVLLDQVNTNGVESTVKSRGGNVAGQLAAVGQDADLLVIGSAPVDKCQVQWAIRSYTMLTALSRSTSKVGNGSDENSGLFSWRPLDRRSSSAS